MYWFCGRILAASAHYSYLNLYHSWSPSHRCIISPHLQPFLIAAAPRIHGG